MNYPKAYEKFTNENGFVRIWKSPDGKPLWLETRTKDDQSYLKLH